MKAYTDKKDFYRGRYREQTVKDMCALEGATKHILELFLYLLNNKDRYNASVLISLVIPIKEMLPYLSLIKLIADEQYPIELVDICYRVREVEMGSINSRLIDSIPSSIDLISTISNRQIIAYQSLDTSIDRMLSQFMEDKEDVSLLSGISFYNESSFLLKIICKRKGWTNNSLNKISLIYR
jgi:hypothetical protein